MAKFTDKKLKEKRYTSYTLQDKLDVLNDKENV